MQPSSRSGTQVVLHDGAELAMPAAELRPRFARKVVIGKANIGVVVPAICMPLLSKRVSQSTMVCALSVLYTDDRDIPRITQQDEFFARFPKAHHAARIVARTERTY
jgi:hypothetical protein